MSGYRYLDERLETVWSSSVPQTDEDAIAYMKTLGIELKTNIMYVEKREPNSLKYNLLPTAYDATKDEFRRVGT